jgi:NADP-reducing hydrogenase subunit HndD
MLLSSSRKLACTVRCDLRDSIKQAKVANKIVVAQVAPSVRVAIGEPWGRHDVRPAQLVTSLRQLGFDYVFDTVFSADVTIIEEGNEFLTRFRSGQLETQTMFTSCCPGWVQLVESTYPELKPQLSSTKSPQQIMGALVKNYFASEVAQRPPEDIYMISIMPCVKKQAEANRPGVDTHPHTKDVDLVVTTQELAKALQEGSVDICSLADTAFDNPMGSGSGGGIIFGRTGGVMLSALRFLHEQVTGAPLTHVDLSPNPVLPSVKEATVDLDSGVQIKIAVVLGLADAKKYVKAMKEGLIHHHFVEVMGCVPAGCVSGGGQPPVGKNKELVDLRRRALDQIDEHSEHRAPHHNPDVHALYKDYLGTEPNHGKAHELLHNLHNTD